MMKKLPNAPKSPVKFWGIVLGILAILIAISVFLFSYQGSSENIVNAAEIFQPGKEWKLESESIEPPRLVCLGGVACPSVMRSWVHDGPVDEEMLNEIIYDTGSVNRVEEDNCVIEDMNKGLSCSVVGEMSGYYTQIYISQPRDDGRHSTLVMFMRKE